MIIKPVFYPWSYPLLEYKERPIRLWLTIKNFPRNIEVALTWCRELIDRGLHGYTKADVWSLDYYLARVIVGTVTKLRESKNCYPCSCFKHNFTKPCRCAERWDKTLTEIIDGFQIILDWERLPLFPTVGSEEFKKINKAMKLLSKNYLNLWD